jgi:hypothetical protein
MPVSLTEINTWPSAFRCDLTVRSRAIRLIDRIDTLEHKIDKHLLQSHSVGSDIGQRRRKFSMDINCRPLSLAAHHADHFLNQFHFYRPARPL